MYDKQKEAWEREFAARDLTLLPHGRRYPERLRFFDEPRQFPESCVCERNLMYNPNVPRLQLYGSSKLPMKAAALDEPGTLQVRDMTGMSAPANGWRLAVDRKRFIGRLSERAEQ